MLWSKGRDVRIPISSLLCGEEQLVQVINAQTFRLYLFRTLVERQGQRAPWRDCIVHAFYDPEEDKRH